MRRQSDWIFLIIAILVTAALVAVGLTRVKESPTYQERIHKAQEHNIEGSTTAYSHH